MTRALRRLTELLLLLLLLAPPSAAHFEPNAIVRAFVFADGPAGETLVYQDIPLPFVVADLLKDVSTVPTDDPTALLYGDTARQLFLLSQSAVASDVSAFEARLRDNLVFSDVSSGARLDPTILAWRIVTPPQDINAPKPARLPWQSATEAEAALAKPGPRPSDFVDMGRARVQMKLALPATERGKISVRASLPHLDLQPGVIVENHIVDLRGGREVIFAEDGQLDTPMVVSPSPLDALREYSLEGGTEAFTRTLTLALLACLALIPGAISALGWRAVSFGGGQVLTLIATALGWITLSFDLLAWLQLAIAATLLYAAIAAVRDDPPPLLAVFAIGLIHGFAFALVLDVILGPDTPYYGVSLSAFIAGILVVQLGLFALIAAAFAGLGAVSMPAAKGARFLALGGVAILGGYWVLQTVPLLV
ncbi:MAG: HupE/UreJ family protein [Pseudomonadota bacterium]